MWRCIRSISSVGDPRSKRGKIYKGSFGKTRPKDPSKKKKAAKRAIKK
jgi:ribosomal small subunit protein bTHX